MLPPIAPGREVLPHSSPQLILNQIDNTNLRLRIFRHTATDGQVITETHPRLLAGYCENQHQFQKGIVKKDGKRVDTGVGLSKQTIVNSLNTLWEKSII